MTLNTKISEILQVPKGFASKKATLVFAAIVCAGGLVTAGLLVSTGTISLQNLRQSAAAVGSSMPAALPTEGSALSSETIGAQKTSSSVEVSDAALTESTPTFDIVRVEPDGHAVLAGLAAPGDQIEVMSDNLVLARADANSSGEWALVLDKPLSVGGHQIAVRSISEGANEPRVSVQNVTVAIPEKPLESAIVLLDQPGEPSTVWQSPATTIRPRVSHPAELLPDLPSSGDAVSAAFSEKDSPSLTDGNPPENLVEQIKNLATNSEPLVTIEAIEAEGAEDLLVSGASRPNATVKLFLDNKLVGETIAGPVGRWHLRTIQTVERGRLILRAEEIEPGSGTVIARREVPFEIDPEIVGSLAATFDPNTIIADKIKVDIAGGKDDVKVSGKMTRPQRVVVGRGDNLWTIARRIYGSGVRYTMLYSANEDQIRNPSTVFPDQVLIVPNEESLAN